MTSSQRTALSIRSVVNRGYMLPLVSRSHVVHPTVSYATCLYSLTPFLRASALPNCNILRHNSSSSPNSWPNLQSPNCSCDHSRPIARFIINTFALCFGSRFRDPTTYQTSKMEALFLRNVAICYITTYTA